MELNDKVTQLEDEIKILKNEVQAVLLDLRESFLSNINPFSPSTIITKIAAPDVPEISNEPTEVPVTTETLIPEPGISDRVEQNTQIVVDNSEEEPCIEADDEENDEIMDVDEGDEDIDDQPGFFTGPESTTDNQESTREVDNMVWHPEISMKEQPVPKEAIAVEEKKLDLEMIAQLSLWVEDAVKRLGPLRTRTILDITETMGYVDSDLKNILVKFIHPASDGDVVSATTRDYLSVLVELNRLLNTDSRMEIALLFILITFQEYDNR
jgi:archaellum component FlaD/FlaE